MPEYGSIPVAIGAGALIVAAVALALASARYRRVNSSLVATGIYSSTGLAVALLATSVLGLGIVAVFVTIGLATN